MSCRRAEKSEGKRKTATQGLPLSHTTGQEVLDGDTLPSCQHTDHQHWTPFSLASHDTCDKYYGGQYHALYFVKFLWSGAQVSVSPGVIYFSKTAASNPRLWLHRRPVSVQFSQGTADFSPPSAFDCSPCDDKKINKKTSLGGIFLSIIVECSFGKSPRGSRIRTHWSHTVCLSTPTDQ